MSEARLNHDIILLAVLHEAVLEHQNNWPTRLAIGSVAFVGCCDRRRHLSRGQMQCPPRDARMQDTQRSDVRSGASLDSAAPHCSLPEKR